ncbi:hypothetical protein BANRA_00874 [Klebsiella variicola]|nr:hypothetical protein [Klebsiella variicola]VCW21638.1 hypothetical protein BANRA_00874 [Klebsiella variicola]
MTSKLTRERIELIANFHRAMALPPSHAEIEELARMALAAIDSEPVAEVVSIYGDPEAFGEREIRPLVGIQQMPYGTKLYRHAQPAQISEPVLPLQDKDLQGAIDALEHPVGINAAGKQVVRHALVELQERRKVERDTEPYGFTDGDRRGMIYKPEHSDRLSEPVPVYRHAQPAPVVQKVMSRLAYLLDEDQFHNIESMVLAAGIHPAGTSQVIPEVMSTEDLQYKPLTKSWREGWNSCRAAMLQTKSLTSINPAPDLVSLQKKAESIIGNYPGIPDCWCRTCRPVVLNDMRFVVCPDCGNKRCPRANDHKNACTGSNEPGQEGSAYPVTPRG